MVGVCASSWGAWPRKLQQGAFQAPPLPTPPPVRLLLPVHRLCSDSPLLVALLRHGQSLFSVYRLPLPTAQLCVLGKLRHRGVTVAKGEAGEVGKRVDLASWHLSQVPGSPCCSSQSQMGGGKAPWCWVQHFQLSVHALISFLVCRSYRENLGSWAASPRWTPLLKLSFPQVHRGRNRSPGHLHTGPFPGREAIGTCLICSLCSWRRASWWQGIFVQILPPTASVSLSVKWEC